MIRNSLSITSIECYRLLYLVFLHSARRCVTYHEIYSQKMTSDMSSTLKLSDTSSNIRFAVVSTPNGAVANRLLSPIIENSTEIQSISIPIDRIRLDSNENTPQISPDDSKSSLNPTNSTLFLRFYQYKSNFQKLRTYFHSIDEHLNELKKILDHLESDRRLVETIDPLATRLIQVRVKVDQIDRLLYSSTIEKIHREKPPTFLLQCQTMSCSYPDLISSIQMSINQKTTLIDHLNNERRYFKYFLNDYANKLKQRQEILLKFTEYFQEKFIVEKSRRTTLMKQCQREELAELVKEYEEVQAENQRLREETKGKLRQCSILVSLDQLRIV